MKTLSIVAAIFAMICAALSTLTAITFCLGMGANSTPAEIRALKLWMLGLTLLGVSGIAADIFLLRARKPGWAAIVGFAPSIIMAVILAVALLQ